MARRLRALCPAKLNPFLAVGPRDERGWHPLRTEFQAIDLCDELVLEEGSATEVGFDREGIPPVNTVTRALEALSRVVPLPPLKVSVTKRIPMESGLGGGSSNAAAVLRAALAWVGASLSFEELLTLAIGLGADVPFFLLGGRARAEGYGEKLEPLPDLPEQHYVVARPSVGCSTPEMFHRLDALSYPWRPFPAEPSLYNDFERVAPCECLDLIERLLVLDADAAGLSGSGSAVFGQFVDHTTALTAANLLSAEPGVQTWVCRSLRQDESVALKWETP